MTYELAKKLKDAGFRQLRHLDRHGSRIDFVNPAPMAPDEVLIARPTMEELIEACGDKFVSLRGPGSGHKSLWYAEGVTDPGAFQHKVPVHGDTPVEAVANLWLALRSEVKDAK